LYTCTLNQTDLIQNSNKFHIMQLLKNNKLDTYCLFSRGGRVGYTGIWNCELYTKLEDALRDWESKFYEKTGYTWASRENITPQPGKYDYIAMKVIDDVISSASSDAITTVVNVEKPKVMDDETEKLMKLIWDPEVFKSAMEEVRIDSRRMPLGKISKKQIDKANDILHRIQDFLDQTAATTKKNTDGLANTNATGSTQADGNTPADANTTAHEQEQEQEQEPYLDDKEEQQKERDKEIKKLSSQFYTIIPYACGMAAPPVIGDNRALEEKVEQLKLLEELLVVQEKMGGGNLDLEQKYLTLNCGIKTVTDPSLVHTIKDYVEKTSGSTHHFRIKVKQIYEIDRVGEKTRFSKHKSLHNHQLLFHGSRLANFVSILSNGLRINPAPQVVRTGSMFGSQAIYFSNASTKSAGYTGGTKDCLMLLAEVALGNTYNLTHAQHITSLPANMHSTWGQGMYTPNPSQSKTMPSCLTSSDDNQIPDITVPCGPLVKSNVTNVYLNYDEFIVYSEDQVKLRYLLWVDL
jgi:predicted DNA-binding WGR domain protein